MAPAGVVKVCEESGLELWGNLAVVWAEVVEGLENVLEGCTG